MTYSQNPPHIRSLLILILVSYFAAMLSGCADSGYIKPQKSYASVETAEIGCENGDIGICYELGGLSKNAGNAEGVERFYGLACDGKFGWACHNLSIEYTSGLLVQQDHEKAENLAERACSLGLSNGCSAYALYIVQKTGSLEERRQYYIQALKLQRQACKVGVGEACFYAASILSDHRVIKIAHEKADTLKLYKRGCQRDHMASCVELGKRYAFGLEVTQNRKKGERYLKRACKAGDREGCHQLTEVELHYGPSGAQGSVKVQQAAKQCRSGNEDACRTAAWAFAHGKGVKRNFNDASKYFTMGCDIGDSRSCYDLALSYHTGGNGAPEDTAKAKSFYKKACQLGQYQACQSYKTL